MIYIKKFNDVSKIIPLDESKLFIFETFKDITQDIVPGVYDYYMISNYGRVYHKYLGIFLKPGISGSGYLYVMMSTDFGPKPIQIHRVELMAFAPIENPELYQVNHKNGNKFVNLIINLEWVTCRENIIHAYRMGLRKRGYKLSEIEAQKICELLQENKYTNKEIASLVGNNVAESNVADIKSGNVWKDISKNYSFSYKTFRLFTNDMINNLCKYFETHSINDLSINNFCKLALEYYNYPTDFNYIDSARKIYTKKYYINISRNYNF